MATLRVPDLGLDLEGSGTSISPVPAQAFALTLSDSVIEDMIRSVRTGNDIQLSLGSKPTFHYGSKRHTPTPTEDGAPLDVFLTKPFESLKQAARIPHTSSLWQKPASPRSDTSESQDVSRSRNLTNSSASSALDSEIETLQNSMAAAERSKKQYVLDELEIQLRADKENSSRIIDTLPAGKVPGRSGNKAKYLSSMASYGTGNKSGSLPSSPALTATGSPSLNQGYGASKQSMEEAKGQRAMIVHELAAAERTFDHLEAKWDGKPEEFKSTLEKVADFNQDTQKWMLAKKQCWKELDVWNYNYDTPEERQSAIDNAVKTFDKMRLGVEEPQWQKLLPKEERGKGKILSKVQANIAKGAAATAPKIKVQKADDAASDAGSEDALRMEGGEAPARSTSQPTKKKVGGADAQVKRLLSTKPKATATPKTSPTKQAREKPGTTAAGKGGRILSAEFVTNSDSESESSESKPMAATSAAKARKPSPVSPAKTREKAPPVAKSTTKARSVEREPIREREPVKSQPVKRRRDETDDSSSSSGVPLAKRMKAKTAGGEKAPIKAPVSLKQTPAPDTQRTTSNGSLAFKSTKNTSPVKSSPLASSPPTNASDFENRQKPPPEPVLTNKKRRTPADISDDGSSSKGSVSSALSNKRLKVMDAELIRKAQVFKRRYEKYAILHRQISKMDYPPAEQLAALMDMRQRLQDMKSEIYKQCPPVIAVV